MACSTYILSGLNVGCKDSMGGIKEVYICEYDKVKATVASNKISTITCEDGKFKTFKFRKNTGSLTSTLQTSETSGNSI